MEENAVWQLTRQRQATIQLLCIDREHGWKEMLNKQQFWDVVSTISLELWKLEGGFSLHLKIEF